METIEQILQEAQVRIGALCFSGVGVVVLCRIRSAANPKFEQDVFISGVVNAVELYYRVEGLKSFRGREWRYVHPRQVAMYLLCKDYYYTYREIGDFFGLDSKTVLYGVRKIGDFVRIYDETRNEVEDLRKQLLTKN